MVMTKEECDDMLLYEDYEFRIIQAHKKGIWPLKFDVEHCKKNLEESIFMCDTGECLGEGWHGGLTGEEWKKRGEYYRKCLQELI